MSKGALAAFETGAVRATMRAEAGGTNAITACVTDVPRPVLGELLSATLTRDPHKLICF